MANLSQFFIFLQMRNFSLDLWQYPRQIVRCGIDRRPTIRRTSSRRFLPKLGPWFATAHFFT